MIIFLDNYRKSRATHGAQRVGYLDRSSYDEAMLSANWTQAEQLMQLLNVSWSEAIRIISLTKNKKRRALALPQALPEDFSSADVGGVTDRATS